MFCDSILKRDKKQTNLSTLLTYARTHTRNHLPTHRPIDRSIERERERKRHETNHRPIDRSIDRHVEWRERKTKKKRFQVLRKWPTRVVMTTTTFVRTRKNGKKARGGGRKCRISLGFGNHRRSRLQRWTRWCHGEKMMTTKHNAHHTGQ